MKSERQERPEDDALSEPEIRMWLALNRANQSLQATQAIQAETQTEATGDGEGERSRVDREVLRAALGTNAPLGRVGH